MSHRIKVEGNFGSAEALKGVLDDANILYDESEENGKTFLTFTDRRYNIYGNPLRICLSSPEDSTMDADIGRTVRGWYRDAMTRHVRTQALMQGATVLSESRVGQNVVLRLAVG